MGVNEDRSDGSPGVQTVLSEINVTPFVDVMLVLLVIFMVTAPLLTQGVEVDLPRISAENLEQMEEQPVVITVNAQGQCFVLENEFACDELNDRLPAIYANRTDKSLFVRGDVDTPYGRLMEVLSAARQAEIISVGLVTEPAGAEPPEEGPSK
ncbi:MAG: protein TolR [Myxococcota bacterium]|nr:protein TolR [Myxococcota bacterium]